MAEKVDKSDKATKIVDVKAPGKTSPSASSRPLVVTNRSVITNDPMVNPSTSAGDEPKSAEQPMARTAKTIKPISSDLTADKPAEEQTSIPDVVEPASGSPEADSAGSADQTATEEPEATKESETAEAANEPEEPVSPAADLEESMPIGRDAEAASHAEEAKAAALAEAEASREAELEQLINSGKYSAPINANHRKRSHALVVAVLALLAVVLAIAVFDAVLDANLVQVEGVPHTDFLKDK